LLIIRTRNVRAIEAGRRVPDLRDAVIAASGEPGTVPGSGDRGHSTITCTQVTAPPVSAATAATASGSGR
jgi:hypothetical protein